MRKINYVLMMGITLFLFSCGNDIEKDTANSNTTHEEHVHNSESIELNNGEKWIVVDEMMGHIKNMENDIKQFDEQKETDYGLLAEKLEDNIDLLTSNCTMEGKAHDELHKWLVPYIDLVGELSDAETKGEEIEAYKEIQSSVKTFNTYFK
ncbi:MAG: hypothetical protein HOK72_10375 [Flavobacteriales bacterium]|nr:hypothetical protein [Flavobacteriales bacterium]